MMDHRLKTTDIVDKDAAFLECEADSHNPALYEYDADAAEGPRQRTALTVNSRSDMEDENMNDIESRAEFDETGECNDGDNKDVRLTLMEEILLLGLKDREGHTSFWNDCISSGLRGAILIELGLRGRIKIEATRSRRSLSDRNIVVINSTLTGDVLLDETLNHLKNCQEKFPTKTWIDYLSGETWNPFRLCYQLRNVRERVAKNLSEKGICSTEKQSYVLFDMTTHPLVENRIKEKILRKVQGGLLSRWCSDLQRIPRRVLSLIYLAQVSDVIENALSLLNDDDYSLAMTHIRDLTRANPLQEASKAGADEIMWAVFASYNN